MSVAQLAIGAAATATATLFKLLRSDKRLIGDLKAHTVIREVHQDSAVITDHPVEFGSPISDHMYTNPKRVDIEIVYGLSSGFNGFRKLASFAGLGGQSALTLEEYYDKFLKLMTEKSLMNIVTGKRVYSNMVVESIENITDVDNENILRLTLRCREVIIVKTSTEENTSSSQADAKNTASPVQQNQTQLGTPSETLGQSFNTYALPPPTNFNGTMFASGTGVTGG